MELLLWRHAQAQPLQPGDSDLERPLTAKGQLQASRVGHWLQQQLPSTAQIWVSPARRSRQTARALARPAALLEQIAPAASFDDAWAWLQQQLQANSAAATTLLLVGHQPLLGQLAAQLLNMDQAACQLAKGALWWLRIKPPAQRPATLRSIINPALI